jgi:hypothetical protein
MERKKFIVSAGAALVGIAFIKSIPFMSFFSSQKKGNKPKAIPNPLAVSRKKTGGANV